MKFKRFSFPTFEEWLKKRKYSQRIGDYKCVINTFAWGCNGNTEDTYIACFADSSYPSNIYVNKRFVETIKCDRNDIIKLKEWYENVTIRINEAWEEFMIKTYTIK